MKMLGCGSSLRDKSQEDNINVFRWFENDDIIASVVQGYFPEECNIRFSFCWNNLKHLARRREL